MMPPWALISSTSVWGRAISPLKKSPPVWNWPASATMKSLAVKLAIYLSISKLLAKVAVTFSSTTARAREVMVTAVLPRLRPRLARAIESRDTPPEVRRARVFLPVPTSV